MDEKWKKLVEYSRIGLRRGDLISFPAEYPFEEHVVMMVCGDPENNRSIGRGLITITGFKAGINPYVVFPDECGDENTQINVDWLIKNWNEWVWPEGNVHDVWAREAMEASEIMPFSALTMGKK